MSTCTECGTRIEESTLLSGAKVYAEMASGNDRDDILSSYSGIKYGDSTVFCVDCLDTPSECRHCGGSGVVESDSDADGEDSAGPTTCSECDGTGTTRPDVLRDSCRF